MLPLRRLNNRATVCIKGTLRPFGRRRNVRSPWRACFYGTSGRGVVGCRIAGLVAPLLSAGAQIDADIGGQPLEQRPRVPGFGILSFLAAE